ncbi:MAG: Transposase [Candidatus Midichloria mitochondrii]
MSGSVNRVAILLGDGDVTPFFKPAVHYDAGGASEGISSR